MAGFGNELNQKLKVDIKAKLTDIGAYVDNELPDYIMVMVANQRTKYQMKDDLSLFLGKNTDEFVDWLHDVLRDLQSNLTSNLESASKKNKKEVTIELEETELKKEKLKKEKKKIKKMVSQEKKINEFSSLDDVTNLQDNKSLELHEENTLAKNDQVEINQDAQAEPEVVLELKRDTNDNDELLLETQEEGTQLGSVQKKTRKLQRHRFQTSVKTKSAEVNSGTTTPSSTIGAIVTRPGHFQKVDDEEIDNKTEVKNNVTSIVKVAERKSSVPLAMQASSLLVLKAVQGAHKSVSSTSNHLKRKSIEFESSPAFKKTRLTNRSGNLKDLDPCDLRLSLETNRAQKDQINEIKYLNNRELENEDTKEKILVRQRFIVTVGGSAKLNKEANTNNKLANRLDTEVEDELLLDEEVEEEFREDNLESKGREERATDYSDESLSAKINERCKYWPCCKNGTQCLYHHPTSQCRSYPNCKFGDKCLFIHPSSTYLFKNSVLANPRTVPTFCRYFPNCFNLNCPFLHPKLCIYGLKCRNVSCPFTHPSASQPTSKNLPKPHQLKWINNLHINTKSNRKFGFEGDPESMPVAIEKVPPS